MEHSSEIRISYDHEGCSARIYRDGKYLGGAYEFAKNHISWEATKDAAVQEAKTLTHNLRHLGPPPESETIPL